MFDGMVSLSEFITSSLFMENVIQSNIESNTIQMYIKEYQISTFYRSNESPGIKKRYDFLMLSLDYSEME